MDSSCSPPSRRDALDQPAAQARVRPLVLRLVSYASHAPDLESPRPSPPTARPRSPSPAPGPRVGQDPRHPRPASPLTFERSASRLLGQFDQTNAKGYYAVEVKGGRPNPPQLASSTFAVNVAPEESRFEMVKDDQVREWLPHADLTFVNASAEQQQIHGALGEEREVWRPLIFVLFAIIGAEFMLATLGGHNRDETGTPRTLRQRLQEAIPSGGVD